MTKIPTKILKLAAEGGWDYRPKYGEFGLWDKEPMVGMYERVALDREFWVCLGKALGWYKPYKGHTQEGAEFEHARQRAHRFYDLILSGQDPTEYWNELLANQKQV